MYYYNIYTFTRTYVLDRIRYNKVEVSVLKDVGVIVSFDLEGNKKPLKLKLVGDQQENVIVHVKNILDKSTRKINGEYIDTYKCQSEIEGYLKQYELQFYRNNCSWKLTI